MQAMEVKVNLKSKLHFEKYGDFGQSNVATDRLIRMEQVLCPLCGFPWCHCGLCCPEIRPRTSSSVESSRFFQHSVAALSLSSWVKGL